MPNYQPLLPIKCARCGNGCVAPVLYKGKPHHKSCLPPHAKLKITGSST